MPQNLENISIMEDTEIISSIDNENKKTNLILIDNRVDDIVGLINGLNTNTLSIIYNYQLDTYDSLIDKINKFNFNKIDNLAIGHHKPDDINHFSFLKSENDIDLTDSNSYNNLIAFFNNLSSFQIENIDFLGCEIASSDNWKNLFSEIKNQLNINVRGSVDITGPQIFGGDFIQEIGDVNLKDIYFTEEIEKWGGTFLSSNLSGPLNTRNTYSRYIYRFTSSLPTDISNISIYKTVGSKSSNSTLNIYMKNQSGKTFDTNGYTLVSGVVRYNNFPALSFNKSYIFKFPQVSDTTAANGTYSVRLTNPSTGVTNGYIIRYTWFNPSEGPFYNTDGGANSNTGLSVTVGGSNVAFDITTEYLLASVIRLSSTSIRFSLSASDINGNILSNRTQTFTVAISGTVNGNTTFDTAAWTFDLGDHTWVSQDFVGKEDITMAWNTSDATLFYQINDSLLPYVPDYSYMTLPLLNNFSTSNDLIVYVEHETTDTTATIEYEYSLLTTNNLANGFYGNSLNSLINIQNYMPLTVFNLNSDIININSYSDWLTYSGQGFASGTIINLNSNITLLTNVPLTITSDVSFNGNNYTITAQTGSFSGCFKLLGGTISNVNVTYSPQNTFLNTNSGLLCTEYSYGNIYNCNTTGAIFSSRSGGIVGAYFSFNYATSNIVNCTHNGVLSFFSSEQDQGGITGAYCAYGFIRSSIVNIINCSHTGVIASNYSGGICGANSGYGSGSILNITSTLNITGCSVYADINGQNTTYGAGGIVGNFSGRNGATLNITGCFTIGNISGLSSGGIVASYAGFSSGICNITDCSYSGTVSGQGSGGIAGSNIGNTSGICRITNCSSVGTVSGFRAGGITGFRCFRTIINNCSHSGTLSGERSGGIVGAEAGYNSQCDISNCSQNGDITGLNAGGIAGDYCGGGASGVVTSKCYIYNCSFSGLLFNSSVGGIVGAFAGRTLGGGTADCRIYNCNSSGTITGYSNAGGIAGNFAGGAGGYCEINNSSFSGIINSSTSGGICGGSAGNSGSCIINNSSFTGSITSSNSGGICGGSAGVSSGFCYINNCYTDCVLSGLGSGGIVGNFAGAAGRCIIENCYTIGNIAGGNCGGITGTQPGSGSSAGNSLIIIRNCYSTGNISGNYAGGILGYASAYNFRNNTNGSVCQVFNCYSTGEITGSFASGIGSFIGGRSSTSVPFGKVYLFNTYTNPNNSAKMFGEFIPGFVYTNINSDGSLINNSFNTLTSNSDYITSTLKPISNQIDITGQASFSGQVASMDISYSVWDTSNTWLAGSSDVSDNNIFPRLRNFLVSPFNPVNYETHNNVALSTVNRNSYLVLPNVIGTSTTSAYIDLSRNIFPGVYDYIIYYGTSFDSLSSFGNVSIGNPLTITGLVGGNTTYYYKLTDNTGYYEISGQFITLLEPPTISFYQTNNTVVVSWTNIYDALNYTIQYANNSGYSSAITNTTLANSIVLTFNNDIAYNTPYWFRVKANNNINSSLYSSDFTKTFIEQTIPDTPSSLILSSITTNSLDVTFTSSNATNYTVAYSNDIDFASTIETKRYRVVFNIDLANYNNTTSVYIVGNFQDTNYDGIYENPAYVNWDPNNPILALSNVSNTLWSITLYLKEGFYEFKFAKNNSGWGDSEFASGGDNRKIFVNSSFTFNTNYDNYKNTVSNIGNVFNTTPSVSFVSDTDTSISLSGLSVNTTYYIKAIAYNIGSYDNISYSIESSYSSTTNAITAPGQITNLEATVISANYITLSWDTQNNVSYQVQRATDISFNSNLTIYTSDISSFNGGNDLSANTTYYYRVRAQNNQAFGQFSETLSATTILLISSSDIQTVINDIGSTAIVDISSVSSGFLLDADLPSVAIEELDNTAVFIFKPNEFVENQPIVENFAMDLDPNRTYVFGILDNTTVNGITSDIRFWFKATDNNSNIMTNNVNQTFYFSANVQDNQIVKVYRREGGSLVFVSYMTPTDISGQYTFTLQRNSEYIVSVINIGLGSGDPHILTIKGEIYDLPIDDACYLLFNNNNNKESVKVSCKNWFLPAEKTTRDTHNLKNLKKFSYMKYIRFFVAGEELIIDMETMKPVKYNRLIGNINSQVNNFLLTESDKKYKRITLGPITSDKDYFKKYYLKKNLKRFLYTPSKFDCKYRDIHITLPHANYHFRIYVDTNCIDQRNEIIYLGDYYENISGASVFQDKNNRGETLFV
jgi:hypothetical protein